LIEIAGNWTTCVLPVLAAIATEKLGAEDFGTVTNCLAACHLKTEGRQFRGNVAFFSARERPFAERKTTLGEPSDEELAKLWVKTVENI
jgi:hypothetical protein